MQLKYLETYLGPNRRSDTTWVEMMVELRDSELIAVSTDQAEQEQRIVNWLLEMECIQTPEAFSKFRGGRDALEAFAGWWQAIVLLLQQSTGHRVGGHELIRDPRPGRIVALAEHEDTLVGRRAGEVALAVLAACVDGFDWPGEIEPLKDREAALEEFRQFARAKVMPADTLAIIDAARVRDIPCIKLEREPYDPVIGDYRLRANSLLQLGHCRHRQILDGTFAIERKCRATQLLHERAQVLRAIGQLGMPSPRHDGTLIPCSTTKQLVRSARKIGFPLVGRPARLRDGRGVSFQADNAEQLVAGGQPIILESVVKGDTFHLLLGGGELIAALSAAGDRVASAVHGETKRLAVDAAATLGSALLLVTVVTPDISESLGESGGVVVDLDVAPRLDQILSADSQLVKAASEKLADTLFPAGSKSRIPLIAVTGTNGKTTTSRMIAHVTRTDGLRTGLVCSDGVFLGEQKTDDRNLSTIDGHVRILESRDCEIAVLESHSRGLAVFGLAFDRCDIAVCTNVSDDHIGDYGVDSVEQMAVLKRSLLERASDAVIVNADDPLCRAMPEGLEAPVVCFVSQSDTGESSGTLNGVTPNSRCVLEETGGVEWIVMESGGSRQPIIPVDEIPATFEGAARFNVSNAMHAIAACYHAGIDPGTIRTAMSQFEAGADMTPGRVNVFDQLPFRIVMDFAHNPDGVKRISEFADRLEVEGRKLIAISGDGSRPDHIIKRVGQAAAGHYDFYFCKNYIPFKNRGKRPTSHLVHQGILEGGVPEDRTRLMAFGKEVIFQIFDQCRPGDLLVFMAGHSEKLVLADFIAEYAEQHSAGRTGGQPS